MELTLKRTQLDDDVTIGELKDADGSFICYILEDTVREPGVKVPGKTAIPYGRYRIVITFSNRFQKPLPLLLDVENYEGIRIHPGNKATDTEGCLLPGITKQGKTVLQSVIAFNKLFGMIKDSIGKQRQVWITITK